MLLGPPSPETLYERARKLMESKNPEDWDRAREGPINTYLASYASRPGEQTAQIRRWQGEIDVKKNELLLQNYLSKKGRAIKFAANNDAEKMGFQGIDAEEEGNLKEAATVWEKMKEKFGMGSGYSSWGRLAENHLQQLEKIKAQELSFHKKYDALLEQGKAAEPGFPTEEERDTFRAFWYEWFGDPFMAQRRFKDLREQYAKDPDKRFWAVLAAGKDRELKKRLDENPDAEKKRSDVVQKKLDEAGSPTTKRDRAYGIYFSIRVLYEKEVSMEPFVKQAEAELKRLSR